MLACSCRFHPSGRHAEPAKIPVHWLGTAGYSKPTRTAAPSRSFVRPPAGRCKYRRRCERAHTKSRFCAKPASASKAPVCHPGSNPGPWPALPAGSRGAQYRAGTCPNPARPAGPAADAKMRHPGRCSKRPSNAGFARSRPAGCAARCPGSARGLRRRGPGGRGAAVRGRGRPRCDWPRSKSPGGRCGRRPQPQQYRPIRRRRQRCFCTRTSTQWRAYIRPSACTRHASHSLRSGVRRTRWCSTWKFAASISRSKVR